MRGQWYGVIHSWPIIININKEKKSRRNTRKCCVAYITQKVFGRFFNLLQKKNKTKSRTNPLAISCNIYEQNIAKRRTMKCSEQCSQLDFECNWHLTEWTAQQNALQSKTSASILKKSFKSLQLVCIHVNKHFTFGRTAARDNKLYFWRWGRALITHFIKSILVGGNSAHL